MKYCILIEITRDTISFYYNKDDGENRFIAYGDEPVKPMALICNGDELSLGSYALKEAQQGNHNAYVNVFDAIQKLTTIEYHGTNYDINKILFLAIEKYIAEFFERIVIRQQGTLEENRANLPLVLVFGNDLKENERSFICKLFSNSGYNHVEVAQSNRIMRNVLDSHSNETREPVIYVGYSNNELYCRLVKPENKESEFTLKGVGTDPRMDIATKVIWEAINQQGYYLSEEHRKEDEKRVHSEALNFINSGEPERNGELTLSDGITYYYFLRRDTLNKQTSSVNDNCQRAYLTLDSQLSSEGIKAATCQIVLVDSDASNDYVESLFKNKFTNVLRAKDNNREEVRNRILESVKKRNYEIGGKGCASNDAQQEKANFLFQNGKFKEARELFRATGDSTGAAKCSECIRNLRELTVANDQTRAQILSHWKELGVSDSVIRTYHPMATTSAAPAATPVIKPEVKPQDDNEARTLFVKGDFKGAREAYRKLGGHADEIRICTECIRSEKGFSYADESTKKETIAKWRKYGLKPSFIASYEAMIKKTVSTPAPAGQARRKATEAPIRKPATVRTASPAKPSSPKPAINARQLRILLAECSGSVRAGKLDEVKRKLLEIKEKLGGCNMSDIDSKLSEKYKELLMLIKK